MFFYFLVCSALFCSILLSVMIMVKKMMVMVMKLKMKPKMQMGMKVEQNHSMMPVPALKPRPSTAQGGLNPGLGRE